MKVLILPIFLQLAGVAVIIAEVVIPSGGLLALLAAALIGYSLFIVLQEISSLAATLFVIADIIIIPVTVVISFRMLARSPVTLRTELRKEDGVSAQDRNASLYLNMEGTAVSDLRPAGTALLDGRRTDVVSRGEYIDKGAKVVVTEVSGNRIVVRGKGSESLDQGPGA